jgi:hypothetical protein
VIQGGVARGEGLGVTPGRQERLGQQQRPFLVGLPVANRLLGSPNAGGVIAFEKFPARVFQVRIPAREELAGVLAQHLAGGSEREGDTPEQPTGQGPSREESCSSETGARSSQMHDDI